MSEPQTLRQGPLSKCRYLFSPCLACYLEVATLEMREPQTWCDKGLLEDEPFLSAFKRQIAGPPARQCTSKDDDASLNDAIANDIKKDGNLLNIAQSWLDFSFGPRVDGGPATRNQGVRANEPGMLNLFVRFYRALSQDHNLAIDILEKERKRRGCYYVLADIRTQQGASLISTVDLLKAKKADAKQKRIKNNLEKSIPAGLQFTKILKVKKDVPDCPIREESPPYLNPTSGISETQDTGQIELNSSTAPLSPDSQNTPAVCDLPKTRKRPQTTPNTRRVKHRRINGTVSDTDDSRGDLEAHPAKTKLPIPEATKKKPIPPPRPKKANTELRCVSNGTINGQSLEKRTKSCIRVDSSQKKLKRQKNHSSVLEKRREHLPQDSQVDAQALVFPSRNLSVTPATNNPSNRGKCAATSRATDPAKGKHGPQQINGVASNKKVIGTNNVPDGLTRNQILNNIKKPGQYLGMHFKRIPKPETSQETEGKLQQGPPVSDSRNHELEGQGTSVPHIDGSVLQSSSDQFNTLAICAPSNSRKRLSSSFDAVALEEGNYATAPKEISIRRAEKATATSHGEAKRRKIVQEESIAESVKDKTTPVHKQFRGKGGKRAKEREPLKVESPERPLIQSETHPATNRPPTNEKLFHQRQQDGMTSNSRSRASSSEDRQHTQQEIAVDQKDPITVQPDPVKMRRDLPHKVEGFEQGDSVPIAMPVAPAKGGRGRPPKSKVLSSTPTQLNTGMAIPFTGQNVGIKQERSISTDIPFPPAQRHDGPRSEETVGELSRPTIDIPRSELDRDMKEESIRPSENWLLAQEHGLVEDHPGDIPPTHKPPLGVKPPIWAQSRQEVCETFDWFRSYQGGVYFAHNMVKGYLLSAFSSKRDRFEHGGRLIISHGGGKAESIHTRKGQTTAQPATDQLAQDKSVRALLDNYRNQRPLVLLIDDKYVLFPYDLGARDMTYVVLGFYTIAHAWAEYQPANNETGRVVRYKFAFRWCDDQGSPWWLTDKETYLTDLTPSTPTDSIHEPASKRRPKKKTENIQDAVLCTTSSEPESSVCMLCHMGSPRVYTWSWACLHPNCSKFWIDIKGNCLPNNLEYNAGFLKLMTSLPIPPDFGKLKPDPPPYPSTDGTVTNYAFTRGFHCKSCGRLSCRLKWEKWECMNCGECLEVSRSVYKAKDFWSTLLPIGYKDHFISKISKIDQQPVRGFRHENGMGSIQSFILPDGRGKIHHIQPGTPLGRLEADEIFIEYQQQATAGVLRFRRWPLRSHKCRGALLSNYFSQNSGEPYQYVGGSANTVPFENAPGAVVRARALIQKRLQQALEMHVEFNEVLSAAYMERQKMAFHSDNEIGLGPLVAGLSLGSPALMHFRIHAKYDPLREQKGNLLSFVLRHGDVLVMDGAAIQEYYEHTVIPNNFRIAATARQINPGHA